MKVTHEKQIASPTSESDPETLNHILHKNNEFLNREILDQSERAEELNRLILSILQGAGRIQKHDEKEISEQVSKEDMPCNKPRASTRPGKKKMVKACEGGKEKIVHFGAKGYGHNYSPKARKSFKARHKCGEKKSKLSAQYWACKNLWAGPKGSKASCPAGKKCKY